MENKHVKNTAIISVSMVLSAVSSVSASPSDLKIDKDFDVSSDLVEEINKITSSKNVHEGLAKLFYNLVNKLSDDDATLYEKYFAEYSDTTANKLAQVSNDSLGNCFVSLSGCYTNCYGNCHGACHGACHGSRGWR